MVLFENGRFELVVAHQMLFDDVETIAEHIGLLLNRAKDHGPPRRLSILQNKLGLFESVFGHRECVHYMQSFVSSYRCHVGAANLVPGRFGLHRRQGVDNLLDKFFANDIHICIVL